MRFTDKNNAIHLLVENASTQVAMPTNSTEFREAAYFISREFPEMRPLFRKSIQYMCRPFWDAFMKAKEKLRSVLQEEPIEKSGTLIFTRTGDETLTIFYDLQSHQREGEMVTNGRIAIFTTIPRAAQPQLTFYTRIKENNTITYQSLDSWEEGLRDSDPINEMFCLILFIKLCPVETKTVAKGKKVSHAREDYLNKTALPVEILDSTWFTTLVRSEGFAVSGHFRLQPVGPGRLERKLIWIEQYEKNGYIREAGVLKAKNVEK